MWQPGYKESLTPLQGVLSKAGATAYCGSVNWVNDDDVGEWNFTEAEDVVDLVLFHLDLLNNVGFFGLQVELLQLVEMLQDMCAQAKHWLGNGGADGLQQCLGPVLELLPRLDKISTTLWHLRLFLDDWEGNGLLENLIRIHQDLEKVQPKRFSSGLQTLKSLLMDRKTHLSGLVLHPFKRQNQGEPNLLRKLQQIWRLLFSVLNTRQDPLLSLQDVLEKLDKVRAIDLRPDDLEN